MNTSALGAHGIWVPFLLIGVMAFLSGCAPPPEPGDGPPINWNTISAAVNVSNEAEAEEIVPFEVQTPQRSLLGDPIRIQVPEPDSGYDPLVVFFYDTPADGRVLFKQSPADLEQGHLEWLAEQNPGYELVPVAGVKGLLIKARGLGRLIWVKDGLRFELIGPSLREGTVRSLARSFQAS